jgi:hypothetical protein
MALPTHCGMPPLSCNVEGLRVHSFAQTMFFPDKETSVGKKKWRAWLVHCLVKSARHYDAAREIILRQLAEATRPADQLAAGRQLHIFDFPEQMEDCITSVFKAAMCLEKLAVSEGSFGRFCAANKADIESLRQFRNLHEHMHMQITNGEVGNGPIILSISEDGNSVRFRDKWMSFAVTHALIQDMYSALASLFPDFDASSAPQSASPTTISITSTMIITQASAQPTA